MMDESHKIIKNEYDLQKGQHKIGTGKLTFCYDT